MIRLALLLMLLAPGVVLAQSPPKPAVSVMTVALRPITVGLTFTGRIAAISRVDLRARVSGYLKSMDFREGQDVKTGDLLFTIEADTYEAVVAQRKADLAAARARLENATVQLARATELLPRQTISQSVYDDRQAQKRIAEAEVLQAEAALRQAEINLGYTRIYASIDGRIGRSNFQMGALVGPDAGALATIVSQDPIYALFPVSQRQILAVRRRLEERGEKASQGVVRLQLSDDSLYGPTGTIDFSDVSVDPSTDSLTIRAVFPNKDRILVDGQFVRVRVEDPQPEQAILVPQRALLNDQAGSYVYVVGPDSKVQARRLRTGATRDADVTVLEGLQVGDRVVLDGIQKIRPGMEVDAAPVPVDAAKG